MITHLLTLANAGAYQGKREWFYPFKDRFLRRWARRDGYDKQVLTHKCWGCNGTKTYKTCYRCNYLGGCDRCNNFYIGPEGECFRCGGTGIHRIDTVWLERWVFGGRVFHVPVSAWHLPVLISPPVVTYTDIIRHAPVDHDRAYRAALMLFAIFEVETLARIVWASTRNKAYRIFRGVRNWWLERQMGPIPF